MAFDTEDIVRDLADAPWCDCTCAGIGRDSEGRFTGHEQLCLYGLQKRAQAWVKADAKRRGKG